MKKIIFCMAAALMLSTFSVNAETAATSGAELGKWTQDFDAAVKLAAEKKVPILLNFSGSDWCGWCKLMVKNVFSKKEWEEYAEKNIALVLVDFPKNKSLVPEKFVDRNEELKDQFGVRGFPTYVVLDCDGKTEVGRLGASREATPESFIADLSKATRLCEGEVKKFTSSLEKGDQEKYLAIVKKLSNCNGGITEAKSTIKEANKRIEELEEKADEIKAEAAEFRAGLKGPEELKKYKELKAEHDKASKELEAWFESDPERTKENMEKMQAMRKKVDKLAGELSAY